MTVRLLLVDDNRAFRELLATTFAQDPELEIVGEAGTGAEGARLAKDLRPDAVVVDRHLPDSDGSEVTRLIRTTVPGAVIVMVTSLEVGTVWDAAMTAGADAVRSKRTPPGDLAALIKRLA